MKKNINKVKGNGTIQEWYQKNKNMWRFIAIVGFLGYFGPGYVASYESNQIQEKALTNNVAENNIFSYSIYIDGEDLIIGNNEDSNINIMTDPSRNKNGGVSCIGILHLSSDFGELGKKIFDIPFIAKGEQDSIPLFDIFDGNMNSLHQLTLTGEIQCNKNDISLDSVCGKGCLNQVIQGSGNIQILLIDRSSNEREFIYADKKKKIIRDIRSGFEGSNSTIKVMHSDAMTAKENFIYINMDKYNLSGDLIVNEILQIIESQISEYNNLPIVIKPMTEIDYRNMHNYSIKTASLLHDIVPRFPILNETTNKYDIRFLDYPENFDLDFWIVLHQ